MDKEKILKLFNNLLKKKSSDLNSILSEKVKELEAKINEIKELEKTVNFELSESEKEELEINLESPEEVEDTQVEEIISHFDMSHFRMLIEKIALSDTQAKILDSMMEGLEWLTKRSYFFVKRGEKLVCFKSTGTETNKTSGTLISFSLNTSLKYIFEKGNVYYGKPDKFDEEYILTKKLEQPEPEEIMVLPIKIKGKTMAAVYVDNKGEKIENTDALIILTTVTSMSLDLLPIKKWVTSTFGENVETPKKTNSQNNEVIEGEEETIEIVEEKLTTEEEKKHKEAKRLVNVIMSDLISYNKDKIEQGIKEGNIYKFLKHEIDQAAAHFYNKIPEKIWRRENYFEKALIEKIAKGNKDLLNGFQFKSE